MKQEHTKYTPINTNKSTYSEMGPVWQNPCACENGVNFKHARWSHYE